MNDETVWWTYKSPGGRRPAAHEVRELTDECKQFLRRCSGTQLMDELRAMMDDNPPDLADARLMLDYLCSDLRVIDWGGGPPVVRTRPDPLVMDITVKHVQAVAEAARSRGAENAAWLIERMAKALKITS